MATKNPGGPAVIPNNKKSPAPGGVRDDKGKGKPPLAGIKNPGTRGNTGAVTRSGKK